MPDTDTVAAPPAEEPVAEQKKAAAPPRDDSLWQSLVILGWVVHSIAPLPTTTTSDPFSLNGTRGRFSNQHPVPVRVPDTCKYTRRRMCGVGVVLLTGTQ